MKEKKMYHFITKLHEYMNYEHLQSSLITGNTNFKLQLIPNFLSANLYDLKNYIQ